MYFFRIDGKHDFDFIILNYKTDRNDVKKYNMGKIDVISLISVEISLMIYLEKLHN